MNAHTHLVGGIVAGALALPLIGTAHPLALLATAALTSPLPDLDHPGSLYGRWMPLPGVARIHGHVEPYHGGWFGNSELSFGHVGRWTPFGILWHRGPFHSPIFLVTGVSVAGLVESLWAPGLGATLIWGTGLGIASHLALDTLNRMGQLLAWPVSTRRIRAPWSQIRVGSWGEHLVALGLVGMAVLLSAPLITSYLPTGIASHLLGLVGR